MCREWNSFVEERVRPAAAGRAPFVSGSEAGRSKPRTLAEISAEKRDRTVTGMGELDRVLGGGIVSGSLTLIGGDPGIGKSTLLLQVCRCLSERHPHF